ncbi:MAG: hypothetical protein JXB38_00970 [Anaerolineales bacterium]|nr:hypothetical protein [Anaerolineales bacterium]
MKFFQRFPIHPLILGLYPPLMLLAVNINETRFSSGFRASAVSFLAATLLYLLLRLFIKDWHRAALLTSLVLIWFFAYGHLYLFLKQITIFGFIPGRHRLLLPLWFALLGVGVWVVLKRVKQPENVTMPLNLITGLLLIFPVIQLINFEFAVGRADAEEAAEIVKTESVVGPQRDVYYIILDAYSRDDTLQDFYEYDNAAFLEELNARGFYVGMCSRSNYPKTRLSLSSTLNMNYLEELDITENNHDMEAWRAIRRSETRKRFEQRGYRVIAFETGFYWTEWESADIYFTRADDPLGVFTDVQAASRLNNFETIFLNTSLGRAVLDLEPFLADNFVSFVNESPRQDQYERVNYTLDTLPKLAQMPEAKFVFAHVLIPHGPYVFGPDGEFRAQDDERGYQDQVTYINTRILEIIDEILANSATPPVIIIQGDHGGPGTQPYPFRMNILNAYYLPDDGNQRLYPAITPVNTFRVIFDTYFGTEYGLIEDVSYYSTEEDFFNFEIYPDTRPGCSGN